MPNDTVLIDINDVKSVAVSSKEKYAKSIEVLHKHLSTGVLQYLMANDTIIIDTDSILQLYTNDTVAKQAIYDKLYMYMHDNMPIVLKYQYMSRKFDISLVLNIKYRVKHLMSNGNLELAMVNLRKIVDDIYYVKYILDFVRYLNSSDAHTKEILIKCKRHNCQITNDIISRLSTFDTLTQEKQQIVINEIYTIYYRS